MSHKFPLRSLEPQFSNACGAKIMANKSNFPILDRLSIYHLTINEGCFREPHWHANADELAYCLEGRALVTIFASGNIHAQFTISEGEMFFVPSGQLHAIENIGAKAAEFAITFSHEMPEDFGLSGFAGCLEPSVLGNTWGLAAGEISGVTRSPVDIQLGRSAGPVEVPESATFGSPFKFPIEARPPLVSAPTGSAIVARRDTWPALRRQAMYSLRLQGIGMREPHWHPETAELGYVHTGHARMTVQSPGGAAETYELHAGDIYFIPRAYPHHIENLTDGEMRFLIFFDTPDVQDIGFTGAIPSFPGRVIGPTLNLTQEQTALIPRRPADLLLVNKTNPVAA
ncbi:MAG TPA: cupin domain-containing protein [Chthoniobacterales bacterium]|nr:cupin domain-containing protein [Chthoniobacterales bacterium]